MLVFFPKFDEKVQNTNVLIRWKCDFDSIREVSDWDWSKLTFENQFELSKFYWQVRLNRRLHSKNGHLNLCQSERNADNWILWLQNVHFLTINVRRWCFDDVQPIHTLDLSSLFCWLIVWNYHWLESTFRLLFFFDSQEHSNIQVWKQRWKYIRLKSLNIQILLSKALFFLFRSIFVIQRIMFQRINEIFSSDGD